MLQSPGSGLDTVAEVCQTVGATCVADPTPPIWDEAQEWEARKKKSGAIARMIYYDENTSPRQDLRLKGGCGQPVVIAAILPDGVAARGGVKPGDRLVSVDGSKDLLELPGEEIHCRLKAPTLLVVTGFVGSLAAEVRICNAKTSTEVAYRSCPTFDSAENDIVLAEETTFSSDVAALFLTISRSSARPAHDPTSSAQMLELHRGDAHSLKATALKWSALLAAESEAVAKASKEAAAAAKQSGLCPPPGAGFHRGRRQLSKPALTAGPDEWREEAEPAKQDAAGGDRLPVMAENAPAIPSRMHSRLGGTKGNARSAGPGHARAVQHFGDVAPVFVPTMRNGSLSLASLPTPGTTPQMNGKLMACEAPQDDFDGQSDSLGSVTGQLGSWI